MRDTLIYMLINEIFYSLQGEGYYTGTPAVFLRFAGCNLECPFCDTDHKDGKEMGVADILREVLKYPARHIVITGGEPALQLTTELIDVLHDAGFYIQVETNGTRRLPEGIDWITCSPKKMAKPLLTRVDELKILFHYKPSDFEYVAGLYNASHYFLQPVSGKNIAEVVDYCLKHPYWRLSLQTHKLIDIK